MNAFKTGFKGIMGVVSGLICLSILWLILTSSPVLAIWILIVLFIIYLNEQEKKLEKKKE